MKKVYLIRHGKSSWENPTLRDAERPLNKRGLRDSPFMANLVKSKYTEIGVFISSPANRAFTTASYFAAEFGVEKENIITDSRIYGAYPQDILDIIREQGNDISSVALFGHNPTITTFANMFRGVNIDNVPTCGVGVFEADIKSWKEFGIETANMTAFYFPKKYFS